MTEKKVVTFFVVKDFNISDLSQFPPEMTLPKPHQNFQICLKSNFFLSRIYTSKCFQDDWSQVNNLQSFTDRHLLMAIN